MAYLGGLEMSFSHLLSFFLFPEGIKLIRLLIWRSDKSFFVFFFLFFLFFFFPWGGGGIIGKMDLKTSK